MNDALSSKRGHVVPKWLEFSKAIRGRDLSIPKVAPFKVNELTKRHIDKEFRDFKQNPSIENVNSLLGTAIVIGDDTLAYDMAKFIKTKSNVDKPIIKLADKILNPDTTNILSQEINVRIANTKRWLSKFPRNAIAWIELARLYTIKGQNQKAKKAVFVALDLSPFDRYVVRCGVRFLLHTHDFDASWHYIHRATKLVNDPLLKATEINVASIANKKTPNFRNFLPKNHDNINVYHFSELFESYGMLELNAGNYSKAKKQFKIAWKDPNETVVSHGEWIIRNRLPGLGKATVLDFGKSHEALTWVHYFNFKLDDALRVARDWELEEPYSSSPFIVASNIACNAGRPDEGAKIAYRGLIANPNDVMLNNNLCYSLLRADRVKEAERFLAKLIIHSESENYIYKLATKGLFEFKKKHVESGRQLYFNVFKLCKQSKKYDLFVKAFLNLALAEIEASTAEAEKTTEAALATSEKFDSPDIKLLRQQVLGKFKKYKKVTH